MEQKEPRGEILYVRIKGKNDKWLRQQKKKLGYGSMSEMLDTLFDGMRIKKAAALGSKSGKLRASN